MILPTNGYAGISRREMVSIDELPNPRQYIELWRVRKGARTLRCVAVYIATGVDLGLWKPTTLDGRN